MMNPQLLQLLIAHAMMQQQRAAPPPGMLPIMLAQAQAPDPQTELENMVRGMPVPGNSQPAPVYSAPAPAMPERVQPGTAIRNYVNDRDAAMKELERQNKPRTPPKPPPGMNGIRG